MQKCPKRLQGSGLKLPPPPPDAAAVAKEMPLLQELLGHDLSYCFRTPVSAEIYKDYGSVVPPEIRMDLGTMVKKIKEYQYERKRGAAAFYRDIDRIWSNCRKYAGCDPIGTPLIGGSDAIVPGIVRCASMLETMTTKFVHDLIPKGELPSHWVEGS